MYIVIIHFIVEKICQTLTAKITHIIFEYFFTHLFLFPNYYQSYVSFRIKKKCVERHQVTLYITLSKH